MYNHDMYEALTERVAQLRATFPGRRILVVRDDFAATFESCKLEKQGVVISATSLDGSSTSLAILWHPRDYSLLVEALETVSPGSNNASDTDSIEVAESPGEIRPIVDTRQSAGCFPSQADVETC